jgi:Predicted flavoproteins
LKHNLIIIGAGAAGLTAAITAKDYGTDIALIEGTDRVGKKILTTGNGRCNITNSTIDSILEKHTELIKESKRHPFLPYHSSNEDFSCLY